MQCLGTMFLKSFRVVACLYSNLTVQVRTFDWQTGMVPFQKGVFQGDPLSVSIFNMVINMYVDQISSPRHLSLAYEYSYSNLTQFADDTSIITNSVKSCQFRCNMSIQFFDWANMQNNVGKCCALAVSSRPKSRVMIQSYELVQKQSLSLDASFSSSCVFRLTCLCPHALYRTSHRYYSLDSIRFELFKLEQNYVILCAWLLDCGLDVTVVGPLVCK